MKKKIKIVVIALLFLLCTGCSETLKDGKQAVINKEAAIDNIVGQAKEKLGE